VSCIHSISKHLHVIGVLPWRELHGGGQVKLLWCIHCGAVAASDGGMVIDPREEPVGNHYPGSSAFLEPDLARGRRV
jgi:hypothetical protein